MLHPAKGDQTPSSEQREGGDCTLSTGLNIKASESSTSKAEICNPHKQIVHAALDRPVRVTLADGRIVQGTLDCFDNSGNMILSVASDVTLRHARGKPIRLGTVLVPGHVSRRILVSPRVPPQTHPESIEDRLVHATNSSLTVVDHSDSPNDD